MSVPNETCALRGDRGLRCRGRIGLRAGAARARPRHAQDMHDMHDMQMDAGWTFMQEGNVYALFNRQGSPRGGDDLEATNWWMGMFTRQTSRHRLTHLRHVQP